MKGYDRDGLFLPFTCRRSPIGPYGPDRETEGAAAPLHFKKIYDIILKKGSRVGASSMFNGFDFYKKFYYNYNGGEFFYKKNSPVYSHDRFLYFGWGIGGR